MERIKGIKWPPALAMVCFFFVPCANAQTLQTAPDEGSAAAQQAPTPTGQQMTNAMYTAFGDNHSRAVHAKGILMQGTFTPDPAARSITKAKLFTLQETTVLARFSDFTGIPTIPDNTMDANPRGMAVKFNVPDDNEVDVVMHSFDGFPTRTSAEFRELLIAVGTSGKGVPKPTPLDTFLASHPIAKTFLTTQKQPPVSYATTAFFGVNSLKFTNWQGQSTYVRYRFVPEAGEHYLDAATLRTKDANYLQTEIKERLDKEPVTFTWYAQVAGPGDVIDDPSIAWPATRTLVRLGVVTITGLITDQASADKKTLFLPGNLPDGMEAADPMIQVRNEAYPISYRHRQ
jgi:catalase